MQGTDTRPKWRIAAGVGAAILVLLAGGFAALILALDAGLFRAPFIAYVQAHFERQIRIEGALRLTLWSRHPRIVAERVTIGNPPWTPPGDMAKIQRLTVQFDHFGRRATLQSIALQGATLHLLRDASGHANWQRFNPDSGKLGRGLPLIRELQARDAHLTYDDQLRHLQFDGTVNAQGLPGAGEASRLHMQGTGQLNGKPATLELTGDALDVVRRDAPYQFEFSAHSSSSRLVLHGSLPQPFDFNVLDASFEAAGADLKDLYFLTGLNLVNTADYHLTGSIARRGSGTRFDALKLTTGQSDISGSLASETRQDSEATRPAKTRPLLQGTLSSNVLHLADFGARAAGRSAPADGPPRLLSDAALNPEALRRGDTSLTFQAQRVDLRRSALQALSGELKIDHGIVTLGPLRANFLQGKLVARAKLDANQAVPTAQVSLQLDDLQLAALDHKPEEAAPLEGLLRVRIEVTGQGVSLHQVAASADGAVSATLPQGTIRDSFAELMGVDLRGLGLTLTHSKREAAVRCAAATFAAHAGTLISQSIVIDTVPVLIEGGGSINLQSESLNLALHGEPKDVRLLRMNAPVLVRGTLAQPSVAIETHDASVKLIDPGHGKDVDCAALLSAASANHKVDPP